MPDSIDALELQAGMRQPPGSQPTVDELDPARALAGAISAQLYLVGVELQGRIVLLYLASSWPRAGDLLQLALPELPPVRWPWVRVDRVAFAADPDTRRTWVVLGSTPAATLLADQNDALAARLERGAPCPIPRFNRP